MSSVIQILQETHYWFLNEVLKSPNNHKKITVAYHKKLIDHLLMILSTSFVPSLTIFCLSLVGHNRNSNYEKLQTIRNTEVKLKETTNKSTKSSIYSGEIITLHIQNLLCCEISKQRKIQN